MKRASIKDTAQGLVYFIETADGQFIKIGYSRRPIRRLSQLGTLRPADFRLQIIGVMPGTLATERWLQDKFSDLRDNGEWFKSSPALREFIAGLGLSDPPVFIAQARNTPCIPTPEFVPNDPVRKKYAVQMGKMGGAARARNLSPERRSEIARKAVQARWNRRAA